MKKHNGLDLLKAETSEEMIKRLEFELIIEKNGRNNDIEFFENELKEIANEFLLICDSGYCRGDLSVGDVSCKFWDDKKGCTLKYKYF